MDKKITDARLFFNHIKKEVSKYYDEREAGSITYLLLERFFSINKNDVIAKKPLNPDDIKDSELSAILQRVKAMEPVQYITGTAYFYGLKLNVNRSVLIPRPETEELVDLIVRENDTQGLKLLDIGTGSGCIAICLKRALAQSRVFALDLSDEALKTAEINARENGAPVVFFKNDILKVHPDVHELDIVVSNPPYVRKKESALMKKNVLNFEPHAALFVPDKDPLLFYKRIISLAQSMLKKGGKLYFEINEAYGKELQDFMKNNSFLDVEIFQDFQGKERMIRGVLT